MERQEAESRKSTNYEAIIQAANSGQLWGIDRSRTLQKKHSKF